MSRTRVRATMLLPVLALLLTLGSLPATPAYASVTGQCSFSHTCMNRWGGGFDIRTWQGYTGNDAVTLHWLGQGNGTFELQDYSGGCIGDLNGNPNDPRAGGGNICPLGGTADWGTVMQAIQVPTRCGAGGYFLYKDLHWGKLVLVPDGSGNQVTLNSPSGTCLAQQSA